MKPIIKTMGIVSLAFLLSSAAGNADEPQHIFYHGINFPQAGFGKAPGIPNQDYMWQSPSDIDLYADMGANIFRVAFLWERMQPALNMPLDPRELAQLDALVEKAASRHVTVLLDVHNYGAYKKDAIGSDAVPVAAFADLWTRLATHYKDQPYVVFGLMNEPNKQKADEWAAIAQQAINAIRKTGAKQTIFVPGTNWSGAHSWLEGHPSNGEALASITDPAHNFIFEAHDYFDVDASGTHPACVSEDIGPQRLAGFTSWLRQTGHKGFLGEFGASKDPVCVEALRRTLKYMADNKDVWSGWSYWAAAPWFGNYMYNVYPPDAERFPQVQVLKDAMQGSGD